MAKATLIFRENGRKISEMTQAEAARIVRDQEARAQMMSELQQAFGTVVNAAVVGDFTQRVSAAFPDKELNSLATGVNSLVEVVDQGVRETGEVLSALAVTDLTKRMTGSYQGALAQLKKDTNAVAENLTEVVTQLRSDRVIIYQGMNGRNAAVGQLSIWLIPKGTQLHDFEIVHRPLEDVESVPGS